MAHKGQHVWKFDKYVGSKCKCCGFQAQAVYVCTQSGCRKTQNRKHLCVGR